jgi:hypothetical protein
MDEKIAREKKTFSSSKVLNSIFDKIFTFNRLDAAIHPRHAE